MKKSISNRDVERIARHADVSSSDVRTALALKGGTSQDLVERVAQSMQTLHYAVTLRDRVAMAAGTSVATVNRAYRPDARHLVRPEVLRAIEREASRLGYAPDPVAQARRAQGSLIITICPNLAHLFNPYQAALLHALSEAITARGFHPVITPIADDRLLPELAQSSVTNAVVLWENPLLDRQIAALNASKRRGVLIGRHGALTSVVPDWIAAFESVTRRALQGGYEVLHLGYFMGERWSCAARLEGMARALEAHRGPPPELRLCLAPSVDPAKAAHSLFEQGLNAAANLIESLAATPGTLVRRPPLGLDATAVEMMQELERQGVSPARRIAFLGRSDVIARRFARRLASERPSWHLGSVVGVSGYDNVEPLLGYVDPIISTVAYDIDALACAVVQNLAVGTGEAGFETVATHLIPRMSL